MEKAKPVTLRTIPTKQRIRFAQFAKLLTNKWYLLIFSALIGTILGHFYYKWLDPVYKSSSTIYYRSELKPTSLNAIFKDLGVQTKNASIQNQIGLLNSYYIHSKSIRNLNWEISYFKKTFLKETDLYHNEPFHIFSTKGYYQTKEIPLLIKILSDQTFNIQTDSKIDSFGIKNLIAFNQNGEFGKLFKNEFFNFTLNRITNRSLRIGDTYVVRFNDLNKMATEYQEKIKVKLPEEGSDIIHIEFESSPFLRGTDYLNEIGKQYIQFGLDEKDRVANNTVAFIDDQIAEISDSLRYTGNAFTNFRSRNLTVDLGKESTVAVEKAQEIDKQSSKLSLRQNYYKNLLDYLGNEAEIKNLVAPSVVGITDPNLNALVLKLGELYSQRETLSYTVQPKNPALLDLDKQIIYTKQSLKGNINNLIANTNMEVTNLNAQKQSANIEISTLPKTEQTLVNIKRAFDLKSNLYTFLLQKRAEAGIARAAHEPEAQVIDPADISTATLLRPIYLIDVIAGFFIGLVIPTGILFIAVFTNNKLKSTAEIDDQLDLAIAGYILHDKHHVELPVVEFPHSIVSESFRGLRSNLQFLSNNKNSCQILAIHSGIVGEGKSFISANLASILAMNGKKVLLIEADLRRPKMRNIFSIDGKDGISDYLQGTKTFNEVVKNTTVIGLDIVFAGSAIKYPSEMLNSEMFKEFILSAKTTYNYIIIDNAPLNIVNDAMQIASYADINLFLIRINYSTYTQLAFINKLAQEGTIKNMLVAVNNVQIDKRLMNKKSVQYYNEEREL